MQVVCAGIFIQMRIVICTVIGYLAKYLVLLVLLLKKCRVHKYILQYKYIYLYCKDVLKYRYLVLIYLREGPWEYHLIYITWEFENFKSVIFWHKMKEHVWKPTNPKFQLNPSMSWRVIEITLMMSQDGLCKNSTFFMLAVFRQFLLNTISYLLMWYLKR